MNKNDKKSNRGPYLQRHEIAFWFPVSKKISKVVEEIRSLLRRTGRPMAPFQVIERAVERFRDDLKEEAKQ